MKQKERELAKKEKKVKRAEDKKIQEMQKKHRNAIGNSAARERRLLEELEAMKLAKIKMQRCKHQLHQGWRTKKMRKGKG